MSKKLGDVQKVWEKHVNLIRTSPNFFMTSPKNVGRSQNKNMLLPIKLGEVCKNKI
jgi:hypothetical protein